MPIRGSPNGTHNLRPQGGRDRPEWVVAINRNDEGSNRARITSIAAGSARDRFEAGLNEAASCLTRPMGTQAQRRQIDS